MGSPPCSNCGTSDYNPAPRSPDMDITPAVLCGVCALLLVSDPDQFEELGRRHRRTGKPALAASGEAPDD